MSVDPLQGVVLANSHSSVQCGVGDRVREGRSGLRLQLPHRQVFLRLQGEVSLDYLAHSLKVRCFMLTSFFLI